MQESILIKNVDIVTQSDIRKGDVYIYYGKIVEIDWHISKPAELVIREPGLTLMPGCIDTHVHFREPGLTKSEDFETGSIAALAGGVTSVFDMPNTLPPTITVSEVEAKKQIAAEKSYVNYNVFIGATADNISQINRCENIAGVKLFLGSSTGDLLVKQRSDVEKVFAESKHLIAVHAEADEIIEINKSLFSRSNSIFDHEKIRSEDAALQGCMIAVEMAQRFNKRVHICHVSTKEEVDFLRSRVQLGLVTTEVTPHHLMLAAPKVYEQKGMLAKVNPPIRNQIHRNALEMGLKSGVLQTIATDHAPHVLAEKQRDYQQVPSGVPGIETALPSMLNGVNQNRFVLQNVVKWMSTNPAKCFGISNKGEIKPGFDADLVLVDMQARRLIENARLYTKCKWSLLDGQTLQGWPVMTIVNGNLVFREGDVVSIAKGKEINII